MPQHRLKSLLKLYLKQWGYTNIISTKEYIVAEGSIPICLVAHLDTVNESPPEEIFYDQEQRVMWSPNLLGADDRAGVYAIIRILSDGYRPHIIFTTDEEKGCAGASTLVTQEPNCPLEKIKAIFQLDRRGSEDCVFYGCDNPDFVKYIESFGFVEAYGTFSDISVIAPEWEVAAVNLSVGYYNEHTNHEYLRLDELETTIERVEKMLAAADDMPTFSYIPAKSAWNVDSYYFHSPESCNFCGRLIKSSWGYKMSGFDKDGSYRFLMCRECYEAYYKSSDLDDTN